MFSSFIPKLPRLSFISWAPAIKVPSVEIHDTEVGTEKRLRTLKHLIKANHANYSIIYNNLRFHNHTPHILGAAYCLGATSEHLHEIYEKETKHLEPWKDAPGEITKDDWRDHLGQREYQRAFIDFFEDQLVLDAYDWRTLLSEYLFEGKNPLINNMVAGLGHPLIHLGYAYELASPTVAIEALALGACFYDFMHKYLDNPSYTKPGPYKSTSPLEILGKVYEDKRFDGVFDHRGPENLSKLFEEREEALLEHWNAWDLTNPKEQFEQSQRTAVALLVAARPSGEKYDFFMVHLLTTSHAIRILLPLIPAQCHVSLVRQWWLFTLAVYIAQLRPEIQMEKIRDTDLKDRTWKTIDHEALTSQWSTDAHYVKGLRAMRVASETWGDDEHYFLRAAVRFADEFDDWGGFDTAM